MAQYATHSTTIPEVPHLSLAVGELESETLGIDTAPLGLRAVRHACNG